MKPNLDRLSAVLSAILSDRYGVRVTVKVEERSRYGYGH